MNIADINAEARSLCDADTTSDSAADLLRRVNSALEELVSEIINADGTWQYDDTNWTDHPVGLGTLVEAQEDYSFSSEYLQIEAIEILDANSPATYRRIKPLDKDELGGLSTEEYFGVTSAGNPQIGQVLYFDQVGDTIRLYPAPTSTTTTLTNGLKIYFKRTADLFTSAQVTTGTKEPGLPSPYHVLLSYFAAIPYCALYKKDRVVWLEKKWDEGILEVIKHYSHREKDRRKIMTMGKINYI